MLGFLSSLFLVTLAELGDKTQLLVLSLATRYKPAKVLAGVFIAIFFLQLLAVVVGSAISGLMPMRYLQIIVALSFIGFGIWMFRGDTEDEEDGEKFKKTRSYGVIAAIAVAFFIAELGDKTQLATISLAASHQSFMGVWFGSTLGMFLADGVAVMIGMLAGKKLPQEKIKYVSAGIFMLFGLITLAQAFRIV